MNYDAWRTGNWGWDYESDPFPREFDFNMKLRGGVVKVQATADRRPEYGGGSSVGATVDSVHWAFSSDFYLELNELTQDEYNEIYDRAQDGIA